jgi:glycosyltransferase involved in cell wall biosynthesis
VANGTSPNKMAILVNSLFPAGAETVAVRLAKVYRERGVDLSFLCLEPGGDLDPGGNTFTLSTLNSQAKAGVVKFLSLYSQARKLRAFVRANGIAVVQSHMYRSNYVNIMAMLMGSRHQAQIVNHGMPGQYSGKGVSGKINTQLIRWLYPRASQLVCPCEAMATEFSRQNIVCRNTKVISNPFDCSEIVRASRIRPVGCDFTFHEHKQYVVVVGRLERLKRVDDILAALAKLRTSFPNLELLILGDGPEKVHLAILAKSLGVDHAVHFQGRVSNPFYFMAQSSLLVSASESEGFGNVLVEALICGTHVLSSRCAGGPCDIVGAAYGCEADKHLFDVGNVAQLVDAARRLLESPPDFNEGQRAHFLSRVDVSRVADDYLAALGEL